MGWTSYHAIHYKNGTVDRKAECDYYWEGGFNAGHFEVVKSRMIGSTYYGAIKGLKKCIGKNEKGEYQYADIPLEEQEIFAVVFLTSVDMKDYHNFSYKDMDESVGPCYYDCPKNILDILSPTDSEFAKEWRRKCYEKIEKRKNPNALNKLSEGSIIQVTLPWETKYHKKGSVIKLEKTKWNKKTRWFVLNTNSYFSKSMMDSFEDNYTLIKKGGE